MKRPRHTTLLFLALVVLCAAGAWFGERGGLRGVPERLEGQLQDAAVGAGLYTTGTDDQPSISVVVIDDNALKHLLDTRGMAWPWSRSVHADVIDELRLHGARTIAVDISFVNARGAEDDRALSQAIGAHGGVILAGRLAAPPPSTPSPPRGAMDDAVEWAERIELADGWTDDSLAREMRKELPVVTAVEAEAVRALQAAYGMAPPEAARWLDQARIAITARRSALVTSADVPALLFPTLDPTGGFPTPSVSLNAQGIGNTAMGAGKKGDADGVVRRVPLWVYDGERAYPMLGLAAALHHADARVASLDPDRFSFETTRLNPVPTGVHRLNMSKDGPSIEVGGVARVRWPTASIDTLFADGGGREVSVSELIDIALVRKMYTPIDGNVRALVNGFGWPLDLEAYEARARVLAEGRPFSDAWRNAWDGQRALWEDLLLLAHAIQSGEDPRASDDDLSFAAEGALELVQPIGKAIEQTDALLQRDPLPDLEGALVFIGSKATKQASDLASTSLAPETPGVYVHAAVAHNVLTGTVLAPGPVIVAPIFAGLLATFGLMIGARTNQWTGLLVCVVIAGLWFVLGAWLLDARLGLGSHLAAPIVSLFLVWLARTTYRALVELRARRRTEERFKTYVSPDVVDILVNNPELSSMEPQRRELTIMFTDIVGFTTMAERLGTERTTDVLSAYLRSMTGVLEVTGATLDKYLGDGIMAFWGAPLENPKHAHKACEAALAMLERLDELNEADVFGEVGPAAIRIGIATGVVSVGDFGNPPHRSAYTVIGDSVNLSARLESANKQLGTTITMNGRCAELIGDAYRTRAVGKLLVVGKSHPEPIRELIGDRTPKGERTEAWIEACEAAAADFAARGWDRSRANYERLRDEFDDGKIAALHLGAIEHLIANPDAPPSIVLTEK